MARSLSIRIGAPPATRTTLHRGGPSRGRTLSQTRARRQGRVLCGLLPTYQERNPRRRCGEAGAPSPLRFGAAEWGASIGRRARRLIGAPTAPPPPRCAIRPRARAARLSPARRGQAGDGLSSLHVQRRDQVRDEWDVACAALNLRRLRALGVAAAQLARGPPAGGARGPARRSTGAGAPSERL